MAELDRLTALASEMAGEDASEGRKLDAIRRLIYENGSWNDYRPFIYNHADPYDLRLATLSGYLMKRVGNCVSMPVLVLVLAHRLGVNMALANAPDHFFVRHRDPSGRILNLEATSGALPARLEWFRTEMPISDRSIESGIYMRSLSMREGIAALASIVLTDLHQRKRYAEALAVADIILGVFPTFVSALVAKGSVYGALIQSEFHEVYENPFAIPMMRRSRYLFLCAQNHALFTAAEQLGWAPDPGREQTSGFGTL